MLRGTYPNENEEWSEEGLHRAVISLVSRSSGTAVDLGSGSGNFGSLLSKRGYDVICVDYNNFLKHPLKFKKADLDMKFPFKKNSANLITAIEIVEHLENPRHFFREIKRVLKGGGTAIITTPNILSWKARIYYLIKGIVWGFREEDYKISGHITPLPEYDLRRICKEVGLKMSKITYFGSRKRFFGKNLIVVVSKD